MEITFIFTLDKMTQCLSACATLLEWSISGPTFREFESSRQKRGTVYFGMRLNYAELAARIEACNSIWLLEKASYR